MFDFFKKRTEQKESAVGAVISMQKVGQPVWSGRNYEKFAGEAYIKNVVAHRCIQLIAFGVSGIKWQLFNDKDEVEKHPLLELLKKPNKKESGAEFLVSVMSDRLISGNCFIEGAYADRSPRPKKAPPVYLNTLRPDRMKVVAGANGNPSAYEYTHAGQSVNFPFTVGGHCNVMHWKSYNPTNDWYGLSGVESGAYAIDQHNEMSAWNQALLQNSATPSGALIYKQENGLTEEQFLRAKSEMDEQFSGTKNAGRPLLLEGDVEWKEMGLSPRDMEFLEGKNSVARDIALAFGVPPMLLGIPGDNTYSNQREARLALWEQTIIPMIDMLVSALNCWLTPRYGDGLRLAYDKDKITALAYRRELLRKSLNETDFMTDNEKREAMGLEAKEGGDELQSNMNKIPMGFDLDEDDQDKRDVEKSLKKIGYSDLEIKKILSEDFGF